MKNSSPASLFASANVVIAMGILAALLAAQWKSVPLPLPALAIVLALTVAKSRLIILDFIGMRWRSGLLAWPLYAWVGFVLIMAIAKASLAG